MERAFLLPWLDVLGRNLGIREPPVPCLRADFKCCLSEWDTEGDDVEAAVTNGSIIQVFSTDSPSQWDRAHRAHLQRVREAVELFNLLSVVDNALFVDMMSLFMVVDRHDEATKVCPTWKFRLIGKLPPEDPIASQSSVSWGQLLGFPEDPWGYSVEFRRAMDVLMGMSEETGTSWHSYARVEWRVPYNAVPVWGLQRNPWGTNDPTTTAEQFARAFGRRLGFDVPSVVHFCALSDGSVVLVRWKREEPKRQQEHPLEVRVWTLKSDFAASGIPELGVRVCN